MREDANMVTRLEKIYRDEVMPKLMQRFGYKNPMQVPRITKITLNMGVGEAVSNKKVLENAAADMAKIAGQKPVITKARVSVASFKIRDGWPIGCKVTLRRARMYEFLDRLINISLPRVRGPRQLQHGRQGADHLPGDRLRPGRCDPRHGHFHFHHRAHRRGSQGAAGSFPLSVQELRIKAWQRNRW